MWQKPSAGASVTPGSRAAESPVASRRPGFLDARTSAPRLTLQRPPKVGSWAEGRPHPCAYPLPSFGTGVRSVDRLSPPRGSRSVAGIGSFLPCSSSSSSPCCVGPKPTKASPNTRRPTGDPITLFHPCTQSDAADAGSVARRAGGRSHRFHPVHPGPRTGRPGMAPVCSPSLTTAMPFTKTCSMPVESWCGSS
jgi:hypothetical protein